MSDFASAAHRHFRARSGHIVVKYVTTPHARASLRNGVFVRGVAAKAVLIENIIVFSGNQLEGLTF